MHRADAIAPVAADGAVAMHDHAQRGEATSQGQLRYRIEAGPIVPLRSGALSLWTTDESQVPAPTSARAWCHSSGRVGRLVGGVSCPGTRRPVFAVVGSGDGGRGRVGRLVCGVGAGD